MRILLQAAHDGLELANLGGGNEVALVKHQRGAELDLLYEERLQVLLVYVFRKEVLPAAKLVEHARAVDDGNYVVELNIKATHSLLLAEVVDGKGDGNGLADAGCLDDYVVEVPRLGDLGKLPREVVGKRAAYAAVGKRHERFVHLAHHAVLLYERGIYVYLANVVYDHGRSDALVVAKDVVEQRGLAGAQVSGNERDLYGSC